MVTLLPSRPHPCLPRSAAHPRHPRPPPPPICQTWRHLDRLSGRLFIRLDPEPSEQPSVGATDAPTCPENRSSPPLTHLSAPRRLIRAGFHTSHMAPRVASCLPFLCSFLLSSPQQSGALQTCPISPHPPLLPLEALPTSPSLCLSHAC